MLRALLPGFVVYGSASALLAALILSDITITAKVLLIGIFAWMWLLSQSLRGILEVTNKICLYARLTFISTELRRLEPESEEPSWDRLKSDMDQERGANEFRKGLVPFRAKAAIPFFIIGTMIVGTSLFYVLFREWTVVREYVLHFLQ
jgi:hypothetical protein